MARRKWSSVTVAMLFALVTLGLGESDPCTYNQQYCSCRMGEQRQGVCWDKLEGSNCRRRFCRPGWTCSCHKRTHLCRMSRRQAHMPSNPRATTKYAQCKTRVVYGAAKPVLKLGAILISISRKGSLADSCNQIAVFHNGHLIANFGKAGPKKLLAESEAVLRRREYYDKLELRPGDLIAFRFFDASYYCFMHYFRAVVDGTLISNLTPGVSLMYARKASDGWYRPEYDMANRMGTSESEKDLTKWIPLRLKTLTSGKSIQPNADYWAPADQSNADNRIQNYYYRMTLPDKIATTSTGTSTTKSK